MSKNKLPSQTMLNPESVINKPYVPHDMRYHAEIQYEGEVSFRMLCCAGDSPLSLATDIRNELRRVKERLPQIIYVEDVYNEEDITEVFIEDFNNGVYDD